MRKHQIPKKYREQFQACKYVTAGAARMVSSPSYALRRMGKTDNVYGYYRNGQVFYVHIEDIEHSPHMFIPQVEEGEPTTPTNPAPPEDPEGQEGEGEITGEGDQDVDDDMGKEGDPEDSEDE